MPWTMLYIINTISTCCNKISYGTSKTEPTRTNVLRSYRYILRMRTKKFKGVPVEGLAFAQGSTKNFYMKNKNVKTLADILTQTLLIPSYKGN